LARWAKDYGKDLNLDPDIPEDLGDRQGDISVPLLSIAEQAGGDWPARAHAALLASFKYANLIGVAPDRLQRPITAAQLADALLPYRIAPQSIRIGAVTNKGYYRHQFTEAWARYLPPDEENSDQAEMPPQPEDVARPNGKDDNDQTVGPVPANWPDCAGSCAGSVPPDAPAKNHKKPSSSAACAGVPDKTPHDSGESVSAPLNQGQPNGQHPPDGETTSSTPDGRALDELRAALIRTARRPTIKIVDLDTTEPEGAG
jgi:hypothetical protein